MRFTSLFALSLALVLTSGCGDDAAPAPDATTPVEAGGDDGKPVPGTETAGTPSTPTAGTPTTAAPSSSTPTNYNGALAEGDAQLNSGEFVDWYTVSAEPGQTITIDMASASNLDPYLLLRGPNGQDRDNDDATPGDTEHSRVEHVVTAGGGGTFQVGATSFQPGETGAYTVAITVGAGGAAPAAPTAPSGGGK